MTDQPESEEDPNVVMLQRHTTMLREQFDTVHIFVSKYDEKSGDTYSYQNGEGNWNARYGQIHQFMKSMKLRKISEDE